MKSFFNGTLTQEEDNHSFGLGLGRVLPTLQAKRVRGGRPRTDLLVGALLTNKANFSRWLVEPSGTRFFACATAPSIPLRPPPPPPHQQLRHQPHRRTSRCTFPRIGWASFFPRTPPTMEAHWGRARTGTPFALLNRLCNNRGALTHSCLARWRTNPSLRKSMGTCKRLAPTPCTRPKRAFTTPTTRLKLPQPHSTTLTQRGRLIFTTISSRPTRRFHS